jgi:hypothetical protein
MDQVAAAAAAACKVGISNFCTMAAAHAVAACIHRQCMQLADTCVLLWLLASMLLSQILNILLAGQATLQLPLARADVCVHLPPALQLKATPAGGVDACIQLLGISAVWPVSTAPGN